MSQRQNNASSRMMGNGIPSSQSSAPRPNPMAFLLVDDFLVQRSRWPGVPPPRARRRVVDDLPEAEKAPNAQVMRATTRLPGCVEVLLIHRAQQHRAVPHAESHARPPSQARRQAQNPCGVCWLMKVSARRARALAYLMAKSSFLSFVPFISSRIHTGVMPRPDHFSDLFFLL